MESLDLRIKNLLTDRDSLRMDISVLIKQRNIYCNYAKRLYVKLTKFYHSADIWWTSLEIASFPFVWKRKIDETTYDCESNIVEYDKIPNNFYAYGIVNINECLNVDDVTLDLLHISV